MSIFYNAVFQFSSFKFDSLQIFSLLMRNLNKLFNSEATMFNLTRISAEFCFRDFINLLLR